MKKIVFILCVFLFVSCEPNSNRGSNECYLNEKFIIVSSNEDTGLSNDKFHKPILVKKWLIQRLSNTTQFAELTSNDSYDRFRIINELWYNKSVGDTLYFEFILKDRFFEIHKKN